VSGVGILADALARVHEGECVVDPRSSPASLPRQPASPVSLLTEREREVLALMAEGRSNTGICGASP
jgi:DNA-binding NarL/FixJ family response regulator